MRKTVISFCCLILFSTIFSYKVWAKYEIEQTYLVAKIQIDQTKPIVKVSYSTKTETTQEVEVEITTNEKIQKVEGWTLEENQKTLRKSYIENQKEEVKIQDLAGNITIVEIQVENIKKNS